MLFEFSYHEHIGFSVSVFLYILRSSSYLYLLFLTLGYFIPIEFLFVLGYIAVFCVVYFVYLSQ